MKNNEFLNAYLNLITEENELNNKQNLADDENTPIETLEQLASDEDAMVRTRLTYRKTLPQSIIEKLSDDPDWMVRADLASRTDLSPEIIEKLSYDNNTTVLERICANPNTPGWILDKLGAEICDDNLDLSSPSNEKTTLVMNIIKNKNSDINTLLKINDLRLSQYLRSELNCHIPRKYCKY